MLIVGAVMTAGTAMLADQGLAQSARRLATGGASQSIILRAVVRPFCKVSRVHHGIHLHGRTDDGEDIETGVGDEGEFTVICNKPYAMNLERSPVWGPPDYRPRRHHAELLDPFATEPDRSPVYRIPVYGVPDLLLERRRVATANATEAFALARGEPAGRDTEPAARDTERDIERDMERDIEVVLSVDSTLEPLQSRCVMAARGDSNFVCHAFSGPEDSRLPLPRLDARFTVTGSTARTPEVASASGDFAPQLLLTPLAGQRDARDERAEAASLDSVVRRRRAGDRLTISVTAKY